MVERFVVGLQVVQRGCSCDVVERYLSVDVCVLLACDALLGLKVHDALYRYHVAPNKSRDPLEYLAWSQKENKVLQSAKLHVRACFMLQTLFASIFSWLHTLFQLLLVLC